MKLFILSWVCGSLGKVVAHHTHGLARLHDIAAHSNASALVTATLLRRRTSPEVKLCPYPVLGGRHPLDPPAEAILGLGRVNECAMANMELIT